MFKKIVAIVWCLSLGSLSGCLSATHATGNVTPSAQLLVVTAADWSSIDAVLQRYERQDSENSWIPVGEKMPAVVGLNGLAWGKGIHPEIPREGPQKREGDGKAPAGAFGLGVAFGYPASESVPWIRLPYRQMTERNKCVDDAGSSFYNRLVDEATVGKDWQSHEEMRRDDGQYHLGIVINHNTDPVVPGGGSCIFLHIWETPSKGTSGCTAVSAADMEELLGWLKPEANPVLIQLHREEYEQLRVPWGLP